MATNRAKLTCIVVVLALCLSFCIAETIDIEENREEDKYNTTAKHQIKTVSCFRNSMIMNSNLVVMDAPSPPPPVAGSWDLSESLQFEKHKKKTNTDIDTSKTEAKPKEEPKPAPAPESAPETKKEMEKKGLTMKEDIIYSLLSSSVKSSLKYSILIKEKKYKDYAKKIGADVAVNLSTKLAFRVIKGPIGNTIQFSLFLGTTILNCKGKTINDSIIHCLKQFIKLIALIIAGVISGKLSKNIGIKAILYGILAYFAESAVSALFNFLLKDKGI